MHSPTFIGLEPTNRCNLNCMMCARCFWNDEANPLGDMSRELFDEKILPEARGKEVLLQLLGEPLLADNFFYMLERLNGAAAITAATTNGVLLAKYHRKLVDLGLDKLILSFDGMEHLKDVRGIKPEVILKGIEKLNAYKKEKGVVKPGLSFNFAVLRENIGDLPDVVRAAADVGAKCVDVFPITVHSASLERENYFDFLDEIKESYKKAQKAADETGVQLNLPPVEESRDICLMPFKQIYVNFNGDVRPCCIATINEENTLKLGNLKEHTLSELWNCEAMVKIRRSLLTGENMHPFCRGCSVQDFKRENMFRILDGSN